MNIADLWKMKKIYDSNGYKDSWYPTRKVYGNNDYEKGLERI